MTATISKRSRSSFTQCAIAFGFVGLSLLPASQAAAESTKFEYKAQIRPAPSCDPRYSDCNSAGMEGYQLRQKGTTTYSDGFKTEERTRTHIQGGEVQWEDKMIREGYFGRGVHSHRKNHEGRYSDRGGSEFYFDRQYLELNNGYMLSCDDQAYVPVQTREGRYVCVPEANPREPQQYVPAPRTEQRYQPQQRYVPGDRW